MTTLLEVMNVVKHFPVRDGLLRRTVAEVHAVDGVSIELGPGETLGVVGESGCGKSTLGRCVVGLLQPTSGEIRLAGQPLSGLKGGELKAFRRRVQMIFQDPYSSLNPRQRVSTIVASPLQIHRVGDRKERKQRVFQLLERVGLPASAADRLPYEFSGGQRQRIGIARALALQPELIVADEPVSALDVSIQAQIINLLMDLQDDLGLAYLFIAHDLGVVRQVSQRIAVMYLGKIVELAPADAFPADPFHPYTHALLAAVPVPQTCGHRARAMLAGEPPSPIDPPSGCRFHPRCPHQTEVCTQVEPPLRVVAPNHFAACHLGAVH